MNYNNEAGPAGTPAVVKLGDQTLSMTRPDFAVAMESAIAKHGYPTKADPAQTDYPMTILLLWLLVVFFTMVYGPIAAWSVELFPTRIRYGGMLLPYHVGRPSGVWHHSSIALCNGVRSRGSDT